jgi:integrase
LRLRALFGPENPIIPLPRSQEGKLMASIGKEAGGTKRILFYAADGKRKTIRLGKATQRQAEAVCLRVEKLVTAKLTGHPPDDETTRWLNEIDDGLRQKLAKAGLITDRESGQRLLKGFLTGYIESRTDVRDRTRNNLWQAANFLIEFLGSDRRLDSITPGDCDQLRVWMLERLSENTVRRHCGRGKQFFRAAVRRKLIAESPFVDMRDCGVRPSDPSRQFFLSEPDSLRVLEECPTLQWKLIFGLARWQAFRTPSEHLRLRWCDLDFEKRTMVIHQSKLEGRGKPTRTMRIFEPVLSLLLELRDIVQPGIDCPFSATIIHADKGQSTNWRQTFEKIVKRAGLEPWPKTFQNLRATRETELAAVLPLHVVTAWCGNTPKVALSHYLMTTSDHHEQASSLDVVVKQADEKAARNPARSTSEWPVTGGSEKTEPFEIPLNSEGFQPVPVNRYPRQDSNL